MKLYNKIILLASVFICLQTSCVKDQPDPVSANFTTNIENNTLEVNKDFVLYLTDAEGEFLTYFRGEDDESTFGIGTEGITVDVDLDSTVVKGYKDPGVYTFTLVARSFGNWGEDLEQSVQSMAITVVE